MGNSHNKTLIVWIDQYINNDENKLIQRELRKHRGLELEAFDSVEDGIKLLKNEKFKNTLIITSGFFYTLFYPQFQNIIKQINIIPKIIIFTSDKYKFISENGKKFPINDPFYNSGGVVDKLEDLKKFIESSIDQNEPGFGGNIDEFFQIQYIKEKNDLILPLYYHDYLKSWEERDIKEFNKTILSENQANTAIKDISQ